MNRRARTGQRPPEFRPLEIVFEDAARALEARAGEPVACVVLGVTAQPHAFYQTNVAPEAVVRVLRWLADNIEAKQAASNGGSRREPDDPEKQPSP